MLRNNILAGLLRLVEQANLTNYHPLDYMFVCFCFFWGGDSVVSFKGQISRLHEQPHCYFVKR